MYSNGFAGYGLPQQQQQQQRIPTINEVVNQLTFLQSALIQCRNPAEAQQINSQILHLQQIYQQLLLQQQQSQMMQNNAGNPNIAYNAYQNQPARIPVQNTVGQFNNYGMTQTQVDIGTSSSLTSSARYANREPATIDYPPINAPEMMLASAPLIPLEGNELELFLDAGLVAEKVELGAYFKYEVKCVKTIPHIWDNEPKIEYVDDIYNKLADAHKVNLEEIHTQSVHDHAYLLSKLESKDLSNAVIVYTVNDDSMRFEPNIDKYNSYAAAVANTENIQHVVDLLKDIRFSHPEDTVMVVDELLKNAFNYFAQSAGLIFLKMDSFISDYVELMDEYIVNNPDTKRTILYILTMVYNTFKASNGFINKLIPSKELGVSDDTIQPKSGLITYTQKHTLVFINIDSKNDILFSSKYFSTIPFLIMIVPIIIFSL